MYTCIHTHIRIYICTFIYNYVYMYVCIYVYMYIGIHICVYTYVYTYMYIHIWHGLYPDGTSKYSLSVPVSRVTHTCESCHMYECEADGTPVKYIYILYVYIYIYIYTCVCLHYEKIILTLDKHGLARLLSRACSLVHSVAHVLSRSRPLALSLFCPPTLTH